MALTLGSRRSGAVASGLCHFTSRESVEIVRPNAKFCKDVKPLSPTNIAICPVQQFMPVRNVRRTIMFTT